MRRHLWHFAVLLLLGFPACDQHRAGRGEPVKDLNVFAAASLAESFGEIGAQFEGRHPGVRVAFNFAGSQQLRSQLAAGAPADVFASANRREMDAAAAAGLVRADAVHTFARNRLVVIYPRSNPGAITSPADLARPHVKIDLADPSVPVGNYTERMLERMSEDPAFGAGFKAGVLGNVVSREENVKSVLNKVRLGEADAGVVYATDASGAAGGEVGVLQVPDRFNPIADYPISTVAKPGQPELAEQFVTFVLSADGQQVMRRHGFIGAGVEKPGER